MRRALVLATALLVSSPTAFAGSGGDLPGAAGSEAGTGSADGQSSILSSMPALTTELPHMLPGRTGSGGAVGTSTDGAGDDGSGGVSDGTVRMLLSPPPANADDDN